MAASISRRTFLRGIGVAGSLVRVGLPPLAAMFNSNGTAYAGTKNAAKALDSRFVIWFNGNGKPEKYWIPSEPGAQFEVTPCTSPLAPYRKDVQVTTGRASPAPRLPGPWNSHYP